MYIKTLRESNPDYLCKLCNKKMELGYFANYSQIKGHFISINKDNSVREKSKCEMEKLCK